VTQEIGRKTKIVCTIGPASESPQILEALIQAGMNVARLNFSHGTHEGHLRKIKTIRQIADRFRQDTDEMLERSKRIPKELEMASTGEKIVIIAGVPISLPGTTNLIKVEIVE
jgi:pyruvate kinase